jgi:AcrR family transcriptional regulator
VVVESIMGGAFQLLGQERDQDTISVQEVADRAGVAIGSLYDYFRDRRTLLVALAAKVTEDNRHEFEGILDATVELSLEEGVGRIVDFCFATLTSEKRVQRALLKIAYTTGLMPTVAESTQVAASALANALRNRSDVQVADVDLAAWTLTHTMMGVVHTIVWEDEPRCTREALRAELVRMYCGWLRGERHSLS